MEDLITLAKLITAAMSFCFIFALSVLINDALMKNLQVGLFIGSALMWIFSIISYMITVFWAVPEFIKFIAGALA